MQIAQVVERQREFWPQRQGFDQRLLGLIEPPQFQVRGPQIVPQIGAVRVQFSGAHIVRNGIDQFALGMGAAARIKRGGKFWDLAVAQAGDRLLVFLAGHSALLPRARRHHTLNAGRQAARLDLRPWPPPLPLPEGAPLPDSKNRR